MKISLVVPVFNEEDVIPIFYDAVRKDEALAAWQIEIVFIDDGSTDATHALITQLSQCDPLVRSLSFIRNFGKEPALFAGLEAATGDAVIPIDVDLQHPGSEPETLALCALIHQLKPAWIVSWHEPLGCIDDPHQVEIGGWLASQTGLPRVSSVGYDTPGSFGSWCCDLSLPCVTAEMPVISVDEATETYLEMMVSLLRLQQ